MCSRCAMAIERDGRVISVYCETENGSDVHLVTWTPRNKSTCAACVVFSSATESCLESSASRPAGSSSIHRSLSMTRCLSSLNVKVARLKTAVSAQNY